MNTTETIRNILRDNATTLRNIYKVKSLGLFGSLARGEETVTSDIDILVDFDEPVGGFHIIGTEDFLISILKRKVDLIPKNAVKGKFEKNILKDLVSI